MKSKIFKYIDSLLILITIISMGSCQDLSQPGLGDYPLDGPVITFLTPNPSGSTVIQSIEPITSITIKFQAEDDIEITNISVKVDGSEIANMSDFANVKMVSVDDLVYDNVDNGTHTVTIIATDSDDNVVTQEVSFIKEDAVPYVPVYDGEIFYMPFEGNFYELVSTKPATEVGSPGYGGEGAEGTSNSFVAGTDNYLTFPTDGLTGSAFSVSFWYKVNGDPDRAGILTVGNPGAGESRTQGFRLFREGNATEQRIKLNVGTGTEESWNDGGVIDATAGEWVNVAFTVSDVETKIYFNGELQNTATLSNMIDWTGCSEMVIGSGAPTFSYWGHLSDSSEMDELRIFNKELTQLEVQKIAGTAYEPLYEGETLYMPFNGNYVNRIDNSTATTVGSLTFAGESYLGSNAYMGATDSYLTYPIDGLFGNEEFTGAFWYKVNADPDRAGILTVAPPRVNDTDDRNSGFRLFREGSATEQRIKLQVGNGADVWNDGDVIDVTAGEWVHIAFTVSSTTTQIYFNGVAVANSGNLGDTPISWAGCTDLSIGSGAPNFIGWGHLSDSSEIDELHLFNHVLTTEEIQAIMNN